MIPNFEIDKPRKSGKRISFLALGFLVLLAAGFFLYAYFKIHKSGSSESEAVTFGVPKGATTYAVANRLEDESLISGSTLFVAYSLFTGSNGKIQAGDYELNRNMSMKEILETLVSGKVTKNEKRAVIVEGWTNAQVQEKLVDLGLVTEGQFEAALKADYDFRFSSEAKPSSYEGYLFPDTYLFNATWDAEQIIQRMLTNFESKMTAQMISDMASKNLNMKDVIIMASIIEREVGRASSVELTETVQVALEKERANVASVFYNRLEAGMPLQSDATVNYATGKSDRRALLEDLDFDSPYNTYANAGLPPGPISNPGIDSIRAAIYPADTDYLYFLNNQRGEAFYGRTLEEHNANRQKYLD